MPTPIQLRDYQLDAVAAVEDAFQSGQRRTLITLPTSSGKAVVFGHLVRQVVDREGRALELVHTEELIDQAAQTLRALLPKDTVGVVRAQGDDASARVVVAIVQALCSRRRLERIGAFNLVMIDEAHHAVVPTYRTIIVPVADGQAA